jgi:hypothetical protein
MPVHLGCISYCFFCIQGRGFKNPDSDGPTEKGSPNVWQVKYAASDSTLPVHFVLNLTHTYRSIHRQKKQGKNRFVVIYRENLQFRCYKYIQGKFAVTITIKLLQFKDLIHGTDIFLFVKPKMN